MAPIAARFQHLYGALVPRGRLARSITVLASSAALGQAVTVVAAPVLTRLYTPEDFGVLAVFTTLLGVIGGAACLRYDAAIPVAEGDEAAANLLAVAVVCTLTVAGLALLVPVFGELIARHLNTPALASLLWLLPLGLVLSGAYNALNFWAVRRRAFTRIARTRVWQSCGQIGVQIGLGLIALAPAGLLIGQVVGQSAGISTFLRALRREDRPALRTIGPRRMLRAAYRYRLFPLFASPAAVLNSLSRLLPATLFALIYGPIVAGWFALAHRVLSTPMRLIGQAVAQVYLGEAPILAREAPQRLRRLFTQTTLRLLLLGLGPTAAVIVAGPWLATIAFGPAWADAGRIMQAIALMAYAQLVVSPISQTLIVFERQDLVIAWDGGRLAAILLTFLGAWRYQWSWFATSIALSAVMVATYVILFMLARHLVARHAAGPPPGRPA